MSYVKTIWEDLPNTTTPITATRLNNIENGIETNDKKLSGEMSAGDIIVDSIRSKNVAIQNNNFTKSGNTLEDIPLAKLSANKTYCISYYTNLNTSSIGWYFKDVNGNNVFNFAISNSTSRVSNEFTPTQDIYFVEGYLNDASVVVYDFQIEEGDTPTEYAPFQDLSQTDEFVMASTPQTNLNVSYYGRALHYKKMGNIVFYQLLINTREASTSTEIFEVTLPFVTDCNWFFPLIKASKDNSFYLLCTKGTNKAYLTQSTNRTRLKCNEVGQGYVIDCEFFAFVKG